MHFSAQIKNLHTWQKVRTASPSASESESGLTSVLARRWMCWWTPANIFHMQETLYLCISLFPTFYSTIFSSWSWASSSAPPAAANVDLNNLLLAFVWISQCVCCVCFGCCVFAGKHFWHIMCALLIVWLWIFVYLPRLFSGLNNIPSGKQQINLNLFKFIAALTSWVDFL